MIGLTAWLALFTQGGIRSGQRVFIHGASGGSSAPGPNRSPARSWSGPAAPA
jgi:hypothetical protein